MTIVENPLKNVTPLTHNFLLMNHNLPITINDNS